MRKKWLLSLSLAVCLSVITACGDDAAKGNDEEEKTQEEDSAKDNKEDQATPEDGKKSEQPKMPEPDLESIPDVVAEVNGEEILKEEFTSTYEGQFQRAAMQSQMSGKKIDQDKLKKQIVEGMISQKLLTQEAGSRDFDASEADVDQKLDELVKQYELKSKEEFMSKLKAQGMEEEEVRSQIKTQVKVDQLVADEAGDIDPTNEELKAAYEQMKAQQEKMGGKESDAPSFEEIKPDLKKQLKNQKRAEATQKLADQLRKDADVTVHL